MAVSNKSILDVFYLFSWETLASCTHGVAQTVYLYYTFAENDSWEEGRLSWALLLFVIITPMSVSIEMAFILTMLLHIGQDV
eukprot:14353858-Ditylum_brightwellii.AAC.1